MSVLCHGSTHVYLTGQARCTCGQAANGYSQGSPTSGMIFQGYNPYSHHTPATPTAPDVPLSRLKAAKDVKAQHLSADGLRAYRDDRGCIEVAHWDVEAGRFDSWWRCAEIAPDAVAL